MNGEENEGEKPLVPPTEKAPSATQDLRNFRREQWIKQHPYDKGGVFFNLNETGRDMLDFFRRSDKRAGPGSDLPEQSATDKPGQETPTVNGGTKTDARVDYEHPVSETPKIPQEDK